MGSAVIGLGVLLWRHKGEATAASPTPVRTRPDMTGWRGSWEREDGSALILMKDDGSVSYSPDGKATLTARATVASDEATFRVKLHGRSWKLRLTRTGDTARLTGLPESGGPLAPVVISPGRSQAEKDADAARRKAETKAMLVPTDMGTFKKLP
jgi:hypothetical protein